MSDTGKTIALIKALGAKISPEDIQSAADSWLEENITNPDSPPLDRSLSSSSAAAPADMVGDLKNALDNLDENQIDITGDVLNCLFEKGTRIVLNGAEIFSSNSTHISTKRGEYIHFKSGDTVLLLQEPEYYYIIGMSTDGGTTWTGTGNRSESYVFESDCIGFICITKKNGNFADSNDYLSIAKSIIKIVRFSAYEQNPLLWDSTHKVMSDMTGNQVYVDHYIKSLYVNTTAGRKNLSSKNICVTPAVKGETLFIKASLAVGHPSNYTSYGICLYEKTSGDVMVKSTDFATLSDVIQYEVTGDNTAYIMFYAYVITGSGAVTTAYYESVEVKISVAKTRTGYSYSGDIDYDSIIQSLNGMPGLVDYAKMLTANGSHVSVLDGQILYAGTDSNTKYSSTTSGDIGWNVMNFPVSEGDVIRFDWDSMSDDITDSGKTNLVYIVEFSGTTKLREVRFGPDKMYIAPSGADNISLFYRTYFTSRTAGDVTLTWTNLLIVKNDFPALNEKYIKPIYQDIEKERIKANQEFVADGNIRRCYNPYKDAGEEELTGQLHCHSADMRGGTKNYYAGSVEGLCQLHRNCGYDFITITDYVSVGLTKKPENTHGLTWLCTSYELSPTQSYQLFNGQHMCIYNTDAFLSNLPNNMTPQNVADLIYKSGRVCDLAHPSWSDLYQSPDKVAQIKGKIRFCEVYDRLNEIEDNVTVPTGKGTDYAWEIMLDNGCIVWGTAVNDAHTGADTNGAVSKGCVKVFASENTPEAIWKALINGCFIASTDTGVSLESIEFANGTLTIGTGNANAVTKFLGYGGDVLKTVTGTTAAYNFDGTEKYVRAVITYPSGDMIWTQPIIITHDLGNFGALEQNFAE